MALKLGSASTRGAASRPERPNAKCAAAPSAHPAFVVRWGPAVSTTRIEVRPTRQVEAVGLDRRCWSSAAPIRRIFRAAFERAGLPYFHPHSFRDTLAQRGERICQSPEQFKAWSLNLGHEKVSTTMRSYGTMSTTRQAEIMHAFNLPAVVEPVPAELAARVAALEARVSVS